MEIDIIFWSAQFLFTVCNCNLKTSSGVCDQSGKCKSCNPGYVGDNCKDCKDGYYMDLSGTCKGELH